MSIPAIDIEGLNPEERLRLIGDLWESLRTHPDSITLTDAQRELLDERLDDLDRGEAQVVSWNEAKQQLLSKPE